MTCSSPWETLHNTVAIEIINISKILLSFTKVQILSHAITDVQTNRQMYKYTHLMALTPLYKCAKLED